MSLTLTAVGHAYGRRAVLADVTLEVAPGDSLALVGPSGSGKTTLLSIIGLLLAPSTGELRLDGVPLPRASRRRSELRAAGFAWVFQTVNVLRGRTALDNVALGVVARGHGRGDADRAAAAALDAVGLAELSGAPVERLSGGEAQRVGIARAVAVQPRFLLADEPTGQLDRSTSDRVLEALWAARHPHTAMVVATHDPEVAARCGRVLQLVDGRMIEAA